MFNVTRDMKPSKSQSNRRIKHPGLIADAATLGVSYQHLFKVLTGERVSISLTRRYDELKSRQSKTAEV